MMDITIVWKKPRLADERGEYFDNEDTKRWLAKRGLVFQTKWELEATLSKGRLEVISLETLQRHEAVNFILTSEELKVALNDQNFSVSYRQMEKTLLQGKIELPAPIILIVGKCYYCFSGSSRISLAFSHHIAVRAWVVKVR